MLTTMLSAMLNGGAAARRWTRALFLGALLGVATTTGAAAEGGPAPTPGFAAAVLDGEGLLLAARDPDAPKAADLTGRLMLMAIAIQDVADGNLRLDEALPYTHQDTIPAEAALRGTVRKDRQGAIAAIALARRLALNPTIMGERMAALGERVGLRGTRISVGRGPNGAPVFEGHSTARDAARLAVALFRAHPERVRAFFSDYTTNPAHIPLALATAGGCVLVSETPDQEGATVRLASVVHNAPDVERCLRAAGANATEHAPRALTLLAR